MEHERLAEGKFYHIYNRGINRSNLFVEPSEYEHFLALYDRYISPVAETLAWVLMGNHFHLVVRIKENRIYRYADSKSIVNADRSIDAVRFEEGATSADLSACAAPVYPFGDNVNNKNRFTRSGLEVILQDTPQDTPQDDLAGMATVKNLLGILNREMTRQEIQTELKLQDRKYLRKSYLEPALSKGLIEMTIPGKPNSRYQKYRLTEKGNKMKKRLKT